MGQASEETYMYRGRELIPLLESRISTLQEEVEKEKNKLKALEFGEAIETGKNISQYYTNDSFVSGKDATLSRIEYLTNSIKTFKAILLESKRNKWKKFYLSIQDLILLRDI